MYVDADIDTGVREPVLAVPESAVLDSGTRQAVLVDKGEGRFEPRDVKLGRRGGGYVEVRDGLSEGEAGRHLRELPDRCREQSESGAEGIFGSAEAEQ